MCILEQCTIFCAALQDFPQLSRKKSDDSVPQGKTSGDRHQPVTADFLLPYNCPGFFVGQMREILQIRIKYGTLFGNIHGGRPLPSVFRGLTAPAGVQAARGR